MFAGGALGLGSSPLHISLPKTRSSKINTVVRAAGEDLKVPNLQDLRDPEGNFTK
jgi:hypothetical protein